MKPNIALAFSASPSLEEKNYKKVIFELLYANQKLFLLLLKYHFESYA